MHTVAAASGARVELERCDTCQGLWLDGPAIPAMCPTVSHLAERRFEVAVLGRQGAGISRCPRCDLVPFELDIIEVPLDFCIGCSGVWFDGDEHAEMVSLNATKASTVNTSRGGAYRSAPTEPAIKNHTACAGCSNVVPIKSTHMWESGPLCRTCHGERLLQETPPQAAASRSFAESFRLLLVAVHEHATLAPRL
ncbi:Hypothetical protein CAP_2168 [Chondromyces apiculatus DSM 436]|uniref:Transcription factor zinc-finger domain-containing protein n=1 Tax=Chondromyces apiculatus DSM 436 TaxID=1192034 RepID=A0A017TBT9_9BACT|nr:Hypothetical protein CAP_2168 [Chondromyces apiculatus DSM 436]